MRTSFLFVSCLFLVACGRPAAEAPGEHHEHKAAEFKKGQGLLVGPEAAKFIGLEKKPVASKGDSPVVPVSAVFETAEGHFAYVENGERLLRTPVRIGAALGSEVAIADGLLEGDVVAVAGVKYLWFAELQAVKGGVGCADGH